MVRADGSREGAAPGFARARHCASGREMKSDGSAAPVSRGGAVLSGQTGGGGCP